MSSQWDPEWIEFAKTMGEAPTLPEEMDERKKQACNAILLEAARRLPPPPSDITTYDLAVPGGPKVRLYIGGPEGKALPMLLFVHGGGWFSGNLETEDRTCRIVCNDVPALVVSVDYRCGFDVPLQNMVDDLYQAFGWARQNVASYGGDPDRTVIWGGSAGGALATALVDRVVKDGNGSHIAGLVSMNGVHLHPDATPKEYKHLNTSYVENAGPLPFVSGDDTLGLFKHRDIEPPNTDLKLFPAAGGAGYLKGFPPTYIITSDNDASRDDGTVFAAALKDAGVTVEHDNVKGLAHYFWTFNLPKANADFWERLVGGIKWILEPKSVKEHIVPRLS